MTDHIIGYLRRHALALAALVCAILAMAGSSYAAFSISGSQIRNHTIDPVKMDPRFVNGAVRAWAVVRPDGHVLASGGRPRVTPLAGDPGGYGIRWRVPVSRCATEVTVDFSSSAPTETLSLFGAPRPFSAGYAVASTGRATRGNQTVVQTFDQTGQPTPLAFDLTLIC